MGGISLISAQMHKIPEYCFLFMWIWPLHEPDLNMLAFFVFYHIVIVHKIKILSMNYIRNFQSYL